MSLKAGQRPGGVEHAALPTFLLRQLRAPGCRAFPVPDPVLATVSLLLVHACKSSLTLLIRHPLHQHVSEPPVWVTAPRVWRGRGRGRGPGPLGTETVPPLPPSRVQGLHGAALSACGPHAATHPGKGASSPVSPSVNLGSDLALHRGPRTQGGRACLSGGGQEPHCRSLGHRGSPNTHPLPRAVLAINLR